MDVNVVMKPEAVATMRGGAKGRVLEQLAGLFAGAYGLDESDVLDGLEARETLGSTGFGKGVAIPHCRNAAARRPLVALLKLEKPCDFAAADAVPVSLVFGLVSPANAGATHLHALAAISRLLRQENQLQALFDAGDGEALFALLTNQFTRNAA